ncbi:hypothetical protein VNO77_44735 [Canavalia gladiata]|uniref:Uncharacterized protein n=1 Tax=Canavalia gladiata TaxID=3824 RepID=A0AAN9JYR5_CANGL
MEEAPSIQAASMKQIKSWEVIENLHNHVFKSVKGKQPPHTCMTTSWIQRDMSRLIIIISRKSYAKVYMKRAMHILRLLRHSYAEPDLKPYSFLELDRSTEIPRPSNGQEPSSYDPEAQLTEDLGVIVTVLSLFSSIRIQIYHVHVQRFKPGITISGLRLLVYLIVDQKGATFHLALCLIEQVLP